MGVYLTPQIKINKGMDHDSDYSETWIDCNIFPAYWTNIQDNEDE